VTVITRSANAGPAAARNAAIDATTCPWVGVLDADDYLLEGRTSALLEHAEDADLIADVLLRIPDRDDHASPRPCWPAQGEAPIAVDLETFVRGNLTLAHKGLELGYLKPMMRRSFLTRHRLRYRTDLRLGEDYELYARALALGGRFFIVRAGGYVSVEREGSLSRKHSEEDLRRLRDCDDELERIRPLSPRERHALRRHASSVDCRLQWRLLINAVKARDLRASLETFRSPATALYLAARLGEQAWLRSLTVLQGRRRALDDPA
jgi:succinoglycan biosynthesis protein ExoU